MSSFKTSVIPRSCDSRYLTFPAVIPGGYKIVCDSSRLQESVAIAVGCKSCVISTGYKCGSVTDPCTIANDFRQLREPGRLGFLNDFNGHFEKRNDVVLTIST